MCESTVFLLEGEAKKKIMEDVTLAKYQGGNVVLIGLLGEVKEIKNGKIVEVNADKHEIVIKV